jgi:hypothetical protein
MNAGVYWHADCSAKQLGFGGWASGRVRSRLVRFGIGAAWEPN